MIQIWGTKKCRETQKTIRFFKERRISFQWIDLAEKGPSKGELKSISKAVGRIPINREGKEFAKRIKPGISFVPEMLAEEYPLVLMTPIVRCGKEVTIGYQPEIWKTWGADKT